MARDLSEIEAEGQERLRRAMAGSWLRRLWRAIHWPRQVWVTELHAKAFPDACRQRWWQCVRQGSPVGGPDPWLFSWTLDLFPACVWHLWKASGWAPSLAHLWDAHLPFRRLISASPLDLALLLGIADCDHEGDVIRWRRWGRPAWKAWWPTMRRDILLRMARDTWERSWVGRGLRRPWRWLRDTERLRVAEERLEAALAREASAWAQYRLAKDRVEAWEQFLDSVDRKLQEDVWKAQGAGEPPKEG
jgi:hypothetical protein